MAYHEASLAPMRAKAAKTFGLAAIALGFTVMLAVSNHPVTDLGVIVHWVVASAFVIVTYALTFWGLTQVGHIAQAEDRPRAAAVPFITVPLFLALLLVILFS